MNRLLFSLLSLLLISTGLGIDRCATFCKFRFCLVNGEDTRTPFSPNILTRNPDRASLPFLCTASSEDGVLGRIRKAGQALVARGRSRSPRTFVPISEYMSGVVRPGFKRNTFRLRPIGFPFSDGRFGVSRRKNRGNQNCFLDNLCVYIPLLRYDLVGVDGKRRVIRSTDVEDCASFRSISGEIVIEVLWDSDDDFDVELTEPNGNVISRTRLLSPSGGRFIIDANFNVCGVRSVGREQITYRKRSIVSPQTGSYGVRIIHFASCDPTGKTVTNYSLAISVRGSLVKNVRGSSSVGNGTLVAVESFEYPMVDTADCP